MIKGIVGLQLTREETTGLVRCTENFQMWWWWLNFKKKKVEPYGKFFNPFLIVLQIMHYLDANYCKLSLYFCILKYYFFFLKKMKARQDISIFEPHFAPIWKTKKLHWRFGNLWHTTKCVHLLMSHAGHRFVQLNRESAREEMNTENESDSKRRKSWDMMFSLTSSIIRLVSSTKHHAAIRPDNTLTPRIPPGLHVQTKSRGMEGRRAAMPENWHNLKKKKERKKNISCLQRSKQC